MGRIIRDLPYFERPSTVQVRGRSFPVKRDQIVLWISISAKGFEQRDDRTPRIKAILDTGCNHNLLINQQQLTAWARLHPDYLPKLSGIRVSGEQVSQLAGGILNNAATLEVAPFALADDQAFGTIAGGAGVAWSEPNRDACYVLRQSRDRSIFRWCRRTPQ